MATTVAAEEVAQLWDAYKADPENQDYRNRLVETRAIDDIGLMTVEGEKDDITGLGQTEAAHDMVPDLPAERRRHHVAEGVGHYGVFNGSRWRKLTEPKVREFILAQRRPV